MAGSPRVKIDTPKLSGTIALAGARIDDLSLKLYHDTIDPKSPPVQLLRPYGAESAFYAAFPWVGADGRPAPGLPDQNTPWTAPPGAVLTPATPLVLTYDNGQGLTFTRTISIDADYMFTIADRVTNAGAQPVSLAPMGLVAQVGTPADFVTQGGKAHQTSTLVHEGGIGVIDGKLKNPSYTCVFGQLFCNAWKKDQPLEQTSDGGWLGITDKYWLAALVPTQGVPIQTSFAVSPRRTDPTSTTPPSPARRRRSPPGASISRTTHLFAGAKIVPLLQAYQNDLRHPALRPGRRLGRLLVPHPPIFSGAGVLPRLSRQLRPRDPGAHRRRSGW